MSTMPDQFGWRSVSLAILLALCSPPSRAAEKASFTGQFYRGTGDGEYLRLLDIARRMFAPDPEYQNLAMLYMPS